MSIGYRIKQKRKELDMSAEHVAEKIGISAATMYRYENGDIEKMPGALLEPLAKTLKTTPAYLMGWVEVDESSLDKEMLAKYKELLAIADDLSEENRKRLMDYAALLKAVPQNDE